MSVIEATLSEWYGTSLAWRARAACAGIDPAVFFPERGCPADEARRICQPCPVRTDCLEYALDNHLRDGIWGGTAEKDRRIILRDRRVAAEQREHIIRFGVPRRRPRRHSCTITAPCANCEQTRAALKADAA